MQFDGRFSGEAAALARAYEDTLKRLPATLHAFIATELQKWAALFPAEHRYQRALLEHLSGLAPTALEGITRGIAKVEADAAVDRISERDPGRFQDLAQGAFRKHNAVSAWRREVDLFFQQVDPALDARLFPPDAPRRLVLQVYGRDIAVQPDRLWSRFASTGVRIPLTLERGTNSERYLGALFGMLPEQGERLSVFSRLSAEPAFADADAWIIESHEAVHDLLARAPGGAARLPLTALSYERLRPYRDALMRALFSKVRSGVDSPQAFAAYARRLDITPEAGVLLNPANIVQMFVRDVLLTGNGTLFVNNTFVEWAAVQALRRAQPRLLVVRYGVRDKLKPFSSLVLFSQPRESDRIPIVEDPVGSFVDVEQLSYYVWVNAEKSAAYRDRTLYLFMSESAEQMLAIRPGGDGAQPPASAVTLADVCATVAQWLGLPPADGSGRPIASLLG